MKTPLEGNIKAETDMTKGSIHEQVSVKHCPRRGIDPKVGISSMGGISGIQS